MKNKNEIDKNLRSYSKYYRQLLINEGIKDIDAKMASYETRLRTMYGSEEYKAHNIYPSTNVAFVYAVIAMCLELKEAGYTDDRIMWTAAKNV